MLYKGYFLLTKKSRNCSSRPPAGEAGWSENEAGECGTPAYATPYAKATEVKKASAGRRELFAVRVFLLLILTAGFFSLGKVVQAADIIWDNSQVRVISYFEVNAWDRLIIKPGTIIKMTAGGTIISYGDIEAIGNVDNPIVFTSLKDDSFGGDTNQDAGATKPAMGDWGYFLIRGEGKRVTMDYVEIHYAGNSGSKSPTSFISVSSYGEPQQKLKEINITHSSIVNNFGSINFYGDAIFKISDSNLYNDINCPLPGDWNPIYLHCDSLSLSKRSGTVIEAPRVYWGHPDGPTTLEDFMQGITKGTRAYYNVNYIPFLIEPWPSDLTGPAEKVPDPVIIVPGIMGSWNVRGVWRIDPIFNTYDNLIEALIVAGYKEDTILQDKPTLFTFPYDWRKDNNFTAGLLKDKIQEVKNITGKSKVDLIAHSMGGLVARSYIQSDDYQNDDIDQIIFLGTPHQGSLESYLKYGGAFFRGKYGGIQKFYFQIEALLHGHLNLVDYIRLEVPTVEQLLPTFNYLKDKQADSSWQLRIYPYNYPRNIFLENLNSEANLVLLKQRSDITNIVSNLGATSTLEFIKVVSDPNPNDNLWQNGYPENLDNNFNSLEGGSGDGTVPYKSANSLVNIKVIETVNNDHNSLPTTMQEEIIETLTGKKPTDYFNNVITSTIKRWSFFRVYSPVDFVVIAPDGKKVGKDFTANTEINEIADAFYSGFDNDTEFVLIPNPKDGQYKVQLQAVGQGGDYTLAASFINDDKPQNTQELQIKSTILASTTDNFSVNFKEDNPTQTVIKSEVDFNKLIELTNLLYQSGEIKKVLVKNLLITQFGYLSKQYDKMISSSNNKQKQLLKTAIILELKLINKTLTLYEIAHFITAKARNILSTNINLLIEKLSI